jgi:hypothetical protein
LTERKVQIFSVDKGMAVKTESLVSLIGSMSPVEKAYFKKYGFKKEGTGKAKMLAMFDLCEKKSNKLEP